MFLDVKIANEILIHLKNKLGSLFHFSRDLKYLDVFKSQAASVTIGLKNTLPFLNLFLPLHFPRPSPTFYCS